MSIASPMSRACLLKLFAVSSLVGLTFLAGGVFHAAEENIVIVDRVVTQTADGRPLSREEGYTNSSGTFLRHGHFTVYNGRDGSKWWEKTYQRGQLNGPYTQWQRGGALALRAQYTNGLESGTWSWWYENGRKQAECVYVKGRIVGSRTTWAYSDDTNSPPRLAKEEFFDRKGNPTRLVGWHTNGVKSLEGGLLPPKRKDILFPEPPLRIGVWKYWNKDGKLIAEGEWKSGEPWNGVCSAPFGGSAGSLSLMGLRKFNRYKRGKLVAENVVQHE